MTALGGRRLLPGALRQPELFGGSNCVDTGPCVPSEAWWRFGRARGARSQPSCTAAATIFLAAASLTAPSRCEAFL